LGLANAHMWEVNMYVSDDREAQIRAAEAAAAKALADEPECRRCTCHLRDCLVRDARPERALREFELAVSLDGNLTLAHGYLGLMKFFLGRARETRFHISQAMRLSTRDPPLFHWHFFIGVADLYLGRMGSALESLRKSVEINPNWGLSQFPLAGALALKGLSAEAAEVCAAARRLLPNFTIAKFRAEAVSDNPVYLAPRASARGIAIGRSTRELRKTRLGGFVRVTASLRRVPQHAHPRPGSAVFSNVLLGVRCRVTDVTQYPIPEILL